MQKKESSLSPQFIAQEMKEAVLGSFPLSPGIFSGHAATMRLYWSFRKDFLYNTTIYSVFGTNDPKPLPLKIPNGHQMISSPEGFNGSVWRDMLEIAFKTHPDVNRQDECRNIISSLIPVDIHKFETRLSGRGARFHPDVSPRPSHLRSFLYEKDYFPDSNEFFEWVFKGMRSELEQAARTGFSESWSHRMKELLQKWSYHMNEPFFPTHEINEL